MLDTTQHFNELTKLLRQYSSLWRCQPFVQAPPWVVDQPGLAQFIRSLDDDTVAAAQARDRVLIETFQQVLPELCLEIIRLTRVAPHKSLPPSEPPAGVPGRKWAQIRAFTESIEHASAPFVEWCSGKGHLSRSLSNRYTQPATALEYDPSLISAGEALASKHQLPVSFVLTDVLQSDVSACLSPRHHAVALHACGGLHQKLLRDCASRRVKRISWSPCCYHKFIGTQFHPQSNHAHTNDLSLSIDEVRNATRQAITAGHGERQQHARLRRWRLGFDQLQRHLRGIDVYLPTPPATALEPVADFATFCQQLAAFHAIELPYDTDFSYFETAGAERYRQVVREELVRALFRRPLELWLVCDEMLFLEERGYRCRLSTFCDVADTPRNLFIDAQLIA